MVGTPQGIAHTVLASDDLRERFGIDDDDLPQTVYAKTAAAARDGDPAAQRVIAAAADFLGTALVSVINTFDLDRVLLAGPGFEAAADAYLEAVRRHVAHSYMRTIHPIEIELRSTSQDIAALGAASLVLHRRLTPHLAGV